MKRYNRRNFTLVELMFVVAILVILIGISWVAGTKVLRSQAKSKTKAEIKMLVSAVEQYKERYGVYPPDGGDYDGTLNFAEYLSKVQPGSGWVGKRPMFIDFTKHNINVDPDTGYDDASAVSTKVLDPYEQDYLYKYDSTTNTYIIYSVGLDSDPNTDDDVSSDDL